MPARKPKPYFLRTPKTQRGRPNKTRKLGYECTYYGPLDGGYTRCVVVDSIVPGWFDPELRSMLPRELIFPGRDHAMTHEMIEMVVNAEVDNLQNLKNQFPEHTFGFEGYMPWAARRQDRVKGAAKRVRSRLPADPRSSSQELISRVRDGICTVDVHILRYKDGDAWGQLTIRHKKDVLTQTLIDLMTDGQTVVHHYPAKYKALGIPLTLPQELTGMTETGKRVVPENIIFRSAEQSA